jgi:hypothetical protein
MDSVLPTNQKVKAISRDKRDVITDRLIELAKTDAELRAILVTALLNPAYCAEQPQIETRRLLAALKVADVAGSHVRSKRADDSASDRSRAVWNLLLSILREQLLRPLVSGRDVRQLRLCLRQLRSWPMGTGHIDWRCIDEDLEVLEDMAHEYDGFPKGPPRRGRRLGRFQQRIIAAVELLRQCGVPDPSLQVVEALDSFGVKREAKTVLNLWSRYRKYPRRHPERQRMPGYHLKCILWLVLRDLKQLEKKTSVSGVGPVYDLRRPSKPRRRNG